jgi:hypothetical protein
VALSILTSILAFTYMLSLPKPKIREIENIKTVVTHVEFHPIGYISVAQIDPEWRIKTSDGYVITSRHQFKIGDTIVIKTIKYGE